MLLKIIDNERLDWVNQTGKKKVLLEGKLSIKDRLIYDCFTENEGYVINEPDKDLLYHPKLAKPFQI